jgi:hypothetical protein
VVFLLACSALAPPNILAQFHPLRAELVNTYIELQTGSTTALPFSIYNDYHEPLDWSASVISSDGTPWLEVVPATGTLPAYSNNRVTAQLWMYATNKPVGRYEATIKLHSAVPEDNERKLWINVGADGSFRMVWPPAGVYLSGEQGAPATASLLLGNSGRVPLYNWRIVVTNDSAGSSSWLSVSPSSGQMITYTGSSNQVELVFKADTSTVAPGYHSLRALVTASNLKTNESPFVIPITVRVDQPINVDVLFAANSAPTNGTQLEQEQPLEFRIDANYRLMTRSSAVLELQLLDQAGNVLSTSDPTPVTKANDIQTSVLTLPPAGQDIRLGTNATKVQLKVVLRDGATVLREAVAGEYPVFAASINKVQLGYLKTFDLSWDFIAVFGFTPFSPSAWVPTIRSLDQNPNELPKALQVTYSLPGTQSARLKVSIIEQNLQGRPVGLGLREVEAEPGIDRSLICLLPLSYRPSTNSTVIQLWAVMECPDGRKIISQPLEVPVASLSVSPVSPPLAGFDPSVSNAFEFTVTAHNPTSDPYKLTIFLSTDAESKSVSRTVASGASLQETIQLSAPAKRWAHAFWRVDTPDASGGVNMMWEITALEQAKSLRLEAGPVVQQAHADQAMLSVVSSSAFDITSVCHYHNLQSLMPSGSPLRNSLNAAGLDLAWEFRPSIPENGALQGTLMLQYSNALSPEILGFAETNLQIASYDSETRQFRTHHTIIDPVLHTATAAIHGLSPYYSLVIVNSSIPSAAIVPLLSASTDIRTRLSWINTTMRATELVQSAFEEDGQLYQAMSVTNPAVLQFSGGSQITGMGEDFFGLGSLPWHGWIEAKPSVAGLEGFEVLESRGDVEMIAVTHASAQELVFPGVTFNDQSALDIEIVNPGSLARRIQLEAIGDNGQRQAASEHWLNAKAKLSRTFAELFSDVTLIGSGYLILNSDGPVTAIAIARASNSIAVIEGQPLRTEPDARVFHMPVFTRGTNGYRAGLTLVNADDEDAVLELKGKTTDGTQTGSPTVLTLGPRKQAHWDIATLVGTSAASVHVTATGGAVCGQIDFQDPLQMRGALASLQQKPERNSILCLLLGASNWTTQISLYNHGAVPARTMVRLFHPTGHSTASNSIVIPAGGTSQTSIGDLAPGTSNSDPGYITLVADQPVIVAALAVSNARTGMSMLPAKALSFAAADSLRLSAASLGNELRIRWPASAVGFRLQSSDSIGAGIAWEAVSEDPIIRQDELEIRVATDSKKRFYRLVLPGTN